MFLQECAYQTLFKSLRNVIWRCSLNSRAIDQIYGKGNNEFWVAVLRSWSNLNFTLPTSKSAIMNEIIWYNSNICIGGKPVMWNHWYDKGIMFTNDIFTDQGDQLSSDDLGVNWLEHHQLIECIPKEWKDILKEDSWGVLDKSKYDQLRTDKGRNKKVYDCLMFDELLCLKYCTRWSEEEGVEFEWETYKNAFSKLRSCTKVSKFRDFKYRLLLGKIITNVDLKSWKLSESDKCTLCSNCQETKLHLFVECEKVKCLWNFVQNLCQNNNIEVHVDPMSILLSNITEPGRHVVNFVSTFTKQYIYRCRCQKTTVNVNMLKSELIRMHTIEYEIARRSNKLGPCKKKWGPIFAYKTN